LTVDGVRRGVIAALVAAVALAGAGNALADTKAILDPNDRPGPLDIRRASHGHAGGRVTHTISTFGTWQVGLLGLNTPNLFALEISTDADRALERVVLVFSANGRLVARVFRLPGGGLVGSASASRPNARTLRVSIHRSRLGNPVGYRWDAISQFQAAGACSRFCIDRAPNFGRILHDITPPAIALTSFPLVPTNTTYDVSFQVSDTGGSGLRRWTLQHRPFGTMLWTTVETGSTGGLKTVSFDSAEDADDQFRVVAVDKQGNQRVSPLRLVSVPLDDRNGLLSYTGTWSQSSTAAGDFLDTLSTSSTPTDFVTLTSNEQYVAWVAPGGGVGVANVSTDEPFAVQVNLADFSGARQKVFQRTFTTPPPHTITITVDSGPVPIDGIIVR
jgi:hypothetical protein